VVVLDVRGISTFCDYFVILSGESLRQVNGFAQAISDELSKGGIEPLSKVPTADESGWIVLDYMSIVVHVFNKDVREFYSLERLWSDARKVRIPLAGAAHPKKPDKGARARARRPIRLRAKRASR
jgi:ribosome-associated protein